MKAAAFEYLRPRTLSEAIGALAGAPDSAKLVAGSQSLGPMLNLRLVRPSVLIDVSLLEELRQLNGLRDEYRIGAAVTHAEIEDQAADDATMRCLASVASGIAYRSVRNRGTIGGSMAHADPAADWPLLLPALGATVRLAGPNGERSVGTDAFMTGPFTTVMNADEVITEFRVPRISTNARFGYFKFCRKVGEFPESSAAALFDPERNVARLFLGALSGAPRPLPALAREVAASGMVSREAIAAHVKDALGGDDAGHTRMVIGVVTRALQRALS